MSRYWAGTSAAIVCQPTLGASRRKAAFRLIGTLTGAVFVVLLTAAFPQNRYGFLLGLAVWGGFCGFASSMLSNFASYGAALAGYTAAIIFSGAIDAPNQVFDIAIARTSETVIGIACGTMVMAGTDLGRARRQLSQQIADLAQAAAAGILATLRAAGPGAPDTRPARRDLIRRTTGLGPPIDTAFGEDADLLDRRQTLWAGVNGIFAALSEWRTIATHFLHLPGDVARRDAGRVLEALSPDAVRILSAAGPAGSWSNDPVAAREICEAASRSLAAMPTEDPSIRLIADRLAAGLRGLAAAANCLVLLLAPRRARLVRDYPLWVGGQDLLPHLVSGVRVLITIVAIEVFWIVTAWPGGQGAIVFAFVSVALLSPQQERAYRSALYFALGTVLGAIPPGITKFVLLPGHESFAGLAAMLALNLIPLGALSTLPRLAPLLTPTLFNFMPILAPTNVIQYNPDTFYNTVLGMVVGGVASVAAMRLIPPVPADMRARRLLAATLAETRDLVTRRRLPSRERWEARIYRRLAAMPEQAEPIQRARLVAALAVGSCIILLRHVAEPLGISLQLRISLEDLAEGRHAEIIRDLQKLDEDLAAQAPGEDGGARLRARAAVHALADALEAHSAYFLAEADE